MFFRPVSKPPISRNIPVAMWFRYAFREVEDLLGEPTVCPFTGQCYYISDKTFIVNCQDEGNISHAACQSFPLTLVVNYSLIEQITPSPQDRLAGIHFGPVGD